MPEPQETVIKGLEPFEIVFGAHQEGITPLHCLRKADGTVVSRWSPSEEERLLLAKHGADIFVFVHSYFQPPMPIDIQIIPPDINVDASREALGLDQELNHRIRAGAVSALPMLMVERKAKLKEQPKKFPSAEEYFAWQEALITEWINRDVTQAEMDFEEWKVAEIVRLRRIVLETVKTV